MVEVGILVAIGAGFAVAQIINNIIMLKDMKKEMKKREDRMVNHMIDALEKMEWRDDKE